MFCTPQVVRDARRQRSPPKKGRTPANHGPNLAESADIGRLEAASCLSGQVIDIVGGQIADVARIAEGYFRDAWRAIVRSLSGSFVISSILRDDVITRRAGARALEFGPYSYSPVLRQEFVPRFIQPGFASPVHRLVSGQRGPHENEAAGRRSVCMTGVCKRLETPCKVGQNVFRNTFRPTLPNMVSAVPTLAIIPRFVDESCRLRHWFVIITAFACFRVWTCS